MQLGFGLPNHFVAKFDDRAVVGGQLDGLRQFAFEAREFYSIAVRHLHRVNIVQHIAHNRKKNIRVFCGGQQFISTFFNYFPRPIQVVDARRIRLRRAWRLSLRYRASHLSAVLSKTFLIVSLLISIPRVCVFFQKKSTQMTKKIAFFRHSPPIICIPIFQNFIRYNLYNNGRGWFSSISISFSNHILSTKGTPYPFPTIRG